VIFGLAALLSAALALFFLFLSLDFGLMFPTRQCCLLDDLLVISVQVILAGLI
jgi:hypothetical protein